MKAWRAGILAVLPVAAIMVGREYLKHRRLTEELERNQRELAEQLEASEELRAKAIADLAAAEAAKGEPSLYTSATGGFQIALPSGMSALRETEGGGEHNLSFRDDVRHVVLQIGYRDLEPAETARAPVAEWLQELSIGPELPRTDERPLEGPHPGVEYKQDAGGIVLVNRSYLVGCRLFALQVAHPVSYEGNPIAVLDSFTPVAPDGPSRCRPAP